MIEEFEKMKLPYGLAFLSGAVEIIMGPLLIVGIWDPLTAGIASGIMVITMIGAAIANFVDRDKGMAIGVLIIFALPMVLLFLYHKQHVLNFLN